MGKFRDHYRDVVASGRGQAIREELWKERLDTYLAAVGKSARDIESKPKGAPWKAAIAAAMKTHATASNPWLAAQLNMGSPFRLSRLASECTRNPAAFAPYPDQIATCKV